MVCRKVILINNKFQAKNNFFAFVERIKKTKLDFLIFSFSKTQNISANAK